MTKKKKIIIATGGTGGPVFPALSFFDFLKKDFDIKIFSVKRGLKFFSSEENENIKLINTGTIFKKI